MLNELPALPKSIAAELRGLADKACDRTISEEECQRLSTLLHDQPAAQLHYLAYMGIHARLGWEFGPIEQAVSGRFEQDSPQASAQAVTSGQHGNDGPSPILSALTSCPSPGGRAEKSWWMASGIGALLAISLSFALLWPRGAVPRNQPTAPPEQFATLTAGVDLEWEEPATSPVIGTRLAAGHYCLAMGIAEVTFGNGAVAVVAGPADLEILGPDHARVHSGQVVVRAEDRAKGFIVETAKATIVDLGTEFGVIVKPSTETEVDVFEGTVATQLNTPKGRETPEQYLRAGQAIHYASAENVPPQTSPSAPNRFVRRMPEQTSNPRRKIPMNHSRFDSIRITTAPPRMTIDGDLSDWNPHGAFRALCEPPCQGTHFVEGRMMYDRKFLYIGAHVGDPAPFRNVVDPRTDADRAWCGGAVQVRISTDRRRGWPLTAESSSQIRGRRALRAEDNSDQLSHLTLWYYVPEARACLFIDHGMDRHGDVVNPPGFRGAFRRDSDGQGYTTEYAIPWSLLGTADDPPRAGDVLATSWNVHWSNESGRIWQGHLVEICNPAEPGWTFNRAATWGRAIYEP